MELTKDVARALVQQASSLLGLFGSTHPKLRAVSNLLNALCEPEVFDQIWAVFTANAKIMAALEDGVAPRGDESLFDALGARTHTDLTSVHAAAKSPAYYAFRQGVMAILALANTFAMFTASPKDDQYVQFLTRIVLAGFDEVWYIDHPDDNHTN